VVTTLWVNANTGERLDRAALETMRRKAHRAYEANTHIFEDEMDALSAFGVLPADEFQRRVVAVAPPALAVA
jgi:hypothetical protein